MIGVVEMRRIVVVIEMRRMVVVIEMRGMVVVVVFIEMRRMVVVGIIGVDGKRGNVGCRRVGEFVRGAGRGGR